MNLVMQMEYQMDNKEEKLKKMKAQYKKKMKKVNVKNLLAKFKQSKSNVISPA